MDTLSPPSMESVRTALQWRSVAQTNFPKLLYSAGVVIRSHLYIHGGQSSKTLGTCSNFFGRIDLSDQNYKCEDLTTWKSPTLSQHTCINFDDNHLVFIGGYDGKKKTVNVSIYSIRERVWHTATDTAEEVVGLPRKAAMTAHNAIRLLSKDRAELRVLIVGQQGKLGCAYLLTGRMTKRSHFLPFEWKFTYTDALMKVSPRRYHSMCLNSPRTFTLIGGRKDNICEQLTIPNGQKGILSDSPSALVDLFSTINQVDKKELEPSAPIAPFKGSVSVACGEWIFSTGGENFNDLAPGALNKAYVTRKGLPLHTLGNVENGRAYAVQGIYDKQLYVYGGLDSDCVIQNDLLILETSFQQ